MKARGQLAPWIVPLLIWLLGTGICLLALARAGPTVLRMDDERAYLSIAQNLRAGNGFCLSPGSRQSWRPPLLPLALAGYDALGLDPTAAARVANALLAGGICVLAYALGLRAFARSVGLGAGVFSALYPPLREFAGLVLTEVPFTFLLALATCLYLGRSDSSPRRRIFLCGLVLGLAALLRPQAVALPALFAVHHWLVLRTRGREVALRLGLMLAAALAVISPWTVRNAVVHHRFVLLTTNGGFNLLAGNLTGYATDYEALLTGEERAALSGASEVERDRLFYRYTFRRFRERPWAHLRLVLEKSARAWFGPEFFIGRLGLSPHEVALVAFALAGVIWALAARNRAAALFLLLVLYFNAVAALFFPDLRFRFPAFPYLMLCAVFALSRLMSALKRRPATG